MCSTSPGLLLYFGAKSSFGEHNSRLEGVTCSDVGGGGAVQTENYRMAPGLLFTSLQTP